MRYHFIQGKGIGYNRFRAATVTTRDFGLSRLLIIHLTEMFDVNFGHFQRCSLMAYEMVCMMGSHMPGAGMALQCLPV